MSEQLENFDNLEIYTQASSPTSELNFASLDDCSVSKELQERERQLLQLEKELQNKAIESVKKTQLKVDQGKQFLENPLPVANPVAKSEPAIANTKHAQVINVKKSKSVSASAAPVKEKEILEFIEIPENLGAEATMRFLRAKMHVMKQELDKALGAQALAEATKAFHEQKIANLEARNAKSAKTIEALQTQLDTMKKSSTEYKHKFEQANTQLSQAKKEAQLATKNRRQIELENQSSSIRLDRALEESEKAKTQLAKVQQETKEATETMRKSSEALQTQNKRLERQKADLIAAFKKQMQLIEVLKRQKLHLEATKALQLKEEEFIKTLDLNSK